MPKQPGFWSVADRLRELSAQGNPLEELLGPAERPKGGRPPLDAGLKFKVPVARPTPPKPAIAILKVRMYWLLSFLSVQ